MMLIQHSVNSDWLLDTQSREPQADWLILENNEKATLNIYMPYYLYSVFLINIFWADLNKRLHFGVFQAFADKSLAEHSLLSAPLE